MNFLIIFPWKFETEEHFSTHMLNKKLKESDCDACGSLGGFADPTLSNFINYGDKQLGTKHMRQNFVFPWPTC